MSLRITFLRHGKADKSLPNHRDHPLSKKGKQQAERRRKQLGNPEYDLVIHSPLRRTQETAFILAGRNKDIPTIEVTALFPRDDDARMQIVDKIFTKCGHSTLSKYHSEGGEKAMTSLALEAHGMLACEVDKRNARNILVVGHGVLLQSICRSFAQRDDSFLEIILGECEGFRLTFDKKAKVSTIERIC